MTNEQHEEVMDLLERMRWALFSFVAAMWLALLYLICSTSDLQWLRELGGIFAILGSICFLGALAILGTKDIRFGDS